MKRLNLAFNYRQILSDKDMNRIVSKIDQIVDYINKQKENGKKEK